MGHGQRCLEHESFREKLDLSTLEERENAIQDWIDNYQSQIQFRDIISIPVVVHVVWFNSNENISDEQILSQIEALNEDFRGLNDNLSIVPSIWQGLIADTEIDHR